MGESRVPGSLSDRQQHRSECELLHHLSNEPLGLRFPFLYKRSGGTGFIDNKK